MATLTKRRIYLGEFNLLMNGSTYLPLVSGLLRANAQQSPIVQEHFAWAPFLFHNDRLDRLVDRYEQPAVAAFSSLMWNAQLSQRVAIRRRNSSDHPKEIACPKFSFSTTPLTAIWKPWPMPLRRAHARRGPPSM